MLNVGCEQKKETKHDFKVFDLNDCKDGTVIHGGEQAWEKNRFEGKNKKPVLDITFGLHFCKTLIKRGECSIEKSKSYQCIGGI